MYEGVRAVWDAGWNTFRLRNGKIIKPPKVFAEWLSHANTNMVGLDGVLWLGYGKQHELAQRLSDNFQDEDLWRNITYLVFDIPNSPYGLEERLALLKSL